MLFYKPEDGWTGDFIPFYWQGEHHLFYLKSYRDVDRWGEGTPWFHLVTTDFVSFRELGEGIPRGQPDEQDLYVYTGCALEHQGAFHIFYTGHNPHFNQRGQKRQAVLHATSRDLLTWEKDPHFALYADEHRYEPHDWRDPFVFWNETAGEFWMLLAARLRSGPPGRRGCTALCVSRDLVHWETREPLWSPGLYYTHECPDLFRWGEWWYLLYSTFSERHVTHYRMSRTLSGPWLAPPNDAFDARGFYAAKTDWDGTRRFAFGWNPTRLGESDEGVWQWGGSLVTHELVQQPDGALAVKLPYDVDAAFTRSLPLSPQPRSGAWETAGNTLSARAGDGFAWRRLGDATGTVRLRTTVRFEEGTRGCGLILRADDELASYFQVRLEPGRQRIVFDRCPRPGDQPFVLERPLALAPGQPVELTVLLDGSIIEVYTDAGVALSARAYRHAGNGLGLFVSEGAAAFSGTRVDAL